MQAVGIGPPILNLKSPTTGRAEAYPAQDMFQSLLQQRILSRGYARSNSSAGALNRTGRGAQVKQARPVSSSSSTSRLFAKMPKFSIRSASSKGSRDPLPLHITEKLSNRTAQFQGQKPLSSSTPTADSSSRSLKLDHRSRTLALIQGNSSLAQFAAAAVPAPNLEMPPALKGLLEFLHQQPGQALQVSQEQVAAVKAFLLKAGLPAEQVEKLLNSDSFAAKGLTANDLQAAWQEACQEARQQTLTAKLAQETQSTAASAAKLAGQMPPVLKKLVELLNQQPGQNLKVPPDRIPEVESFLLKSGIAPEQVEQLLNSPRFQEQGLTAGDVQTAWQNSVQGSIQQAQASLNPGQNASLANLTTRSDYRQIWENLVLPPESLADLRLGLQELGVPPEALAKLNEQNFPQGVHLSQVWELIQQIPKQSFATSASAEAAKNNAFSQSPLLLNGGEDLEKWRQFLVKAGMDPELAQTLVSGPNPATREELRTGLLKMAPQSASLQELAVPKPLYLPQSVRVRTLPLLQQQPNPGQWETGAGGNWTQNFTFSSPTPEVNLAGATDLNNFLALLTGSAPLQTDPSFSAAGAQGQASVANTYLTPAAREAIWSQVQAGVLGNLRPGVNQVTLTLNPPEMGKLHLSLNVKGGMVEVSAVASQAAVAEAGAAGVQQLAQALHQQGLTLTHFQFHHQDQAPRQSDLAFFQDSGDRRQAGKKDLDRWDQPPNPRRQRWGRGIDCFA